MRGIPNLIGLAFRRLGMQLADDSRKCLLGLPFRFIRRDFRIGAVAPATNHNDSNNNDNSNDENDAHSDSSDCSNL